MFEALLIIWIGVAQAQTVPIIRYESVEQCELARDAVLKRFYDKDRWLNHIGPQDVECLKVPKVPA